MANSIYESTGDGSTTDFVLPYEYLEEDDITVFVDGVSTAYTYTSASIISLTTAPASGAAVRIVRNTDIAALNVTYSDGGALTAKQLNDSNTQLLYAAQEAIDKASESITVDDDGKWDADSKVIKNVADPVNDDDAVNKTYLEDTWLTTSDKAQLNSLDLDNLNDVADDVANVNTVAGSIANVNTVAGIDSNVTTVAGVSANVTTVAGISSDVTTVAGDSADIQAVADKTAEIGRLGTADAVADMNTLGTAAIVSDLDTLADISTDIEDVADIASDVTTVANNDANVTTVAGNNANITTVAGVSSDVTTVAGISANVTTVANDGTDIGTVAGISSNVTTVAGISSDVSTVAGISADVTTAATNAADITAVADEVSKVISVANDLAEATSEIDVVAGSIANVDLVGGSISNVNSVASNLADVNSFADTYFISATVPSSPTEGDLWFDTTNDIMKVYDGSGFVNAGSSVNGTANRESYVVGTSEGSYTGSTTVFPATYDSGYIDVYLNGVKLTEDDFTATNGTSITLDDAATSGDSLDIIGYGTFELLNLDISNDSSPTLGGNLTLGGYDITGTGDINVTGTVTSDGLTVDTDTLHVDATNNRVGIGTTSPDRDLHVEQSGHAKIKVESTGTNASIEIHADSGGDNKGHFRISGDPTSSGGLFIYDETNSAERLRILSSGGITFNGDTAQANALDDYEEGSWTPFFDAVTAPSYGTQNGKYTKIGNVVYCEAIINVNSGLSNTDTSGFQISGLPYAKASDLAQSCLFNWDASNSTLLDATHDNIGGARITGSTIIITQNNSGSGTDITYAELSRTDGAFYFAFQYRT